MNIFLNALLFVFIPARLRFVVLMGVGLSIVEASFSQDSLPEKKKYQQTIEFAGDGFINSNAVTNDFIKAFYQGKFLDVELKETVSNKLRAENRLGAESKLGFTYTNKLKGRKNSFFYFSFFDRVHANFSFSDDLFDVIFYGNKMFAGDTAKLGNFRVNFLRYQQFQFGWKWNGDERHGSYGFAFSLLSGDQNQYIDGNTSGLFTADDGSYLTLPLSMKVFHTDTAKAKLFSQNGMGASVDFFYEMPYIFANKPGKITLALNDLGFIRWNSNSMHFKVDTFYSFSGITADDLVHLDSSAFSSSNTDSIIDRNAKVKRAQYKTDVPCTLDIHIKTLYGKQFALEKGFKYYFNTSAFPYFYLKLHFNFGRKQNFHVSYVGGYGGYGKFNSGLEINFDFAKQYSIYLADNYLFSGIASTSYGMGLYAKLVRRF